NQHGLRVTGSELVGLVPKRVMVEAGKYFLKQQRRSVGIAEEELIRLAVKSLGLDELSPFEPRKKIIEYLLEEEGQSPLIAMDLKAFAQETASESMAPGGGSISAYVGALGVSLGTMVANLSAHRRVWDERWEEFSEWAEKGQAIQERLLHLVDEDTRSFNGIIDAIRMPKGTEDEKAIRKQAIQEATKYAIEVPFQVVKATFESLEVIRAMAEKGNPSSVSDAGVGALCARAAIHGAFLNMQINSADLEDKQYVEEVISQGKAIIEQTDALEQEIMNLVRTKL
ncbi:MAG: cyclodeaminase/cyclohydrolase family protein, partial [Phaeodactylibacter sp.]|nr:cyclodeaminase/cyclohydrolase family protein [Phaeodactylibacter sp.]